MFFGFGDHGCLEVEIEKFDPAQPFINRASFLKAARSISF